jgi:predicted nucleic acid-binding protein
MTSIVVDTSVLIKWFHTDGESEVTEAQAILAAHRDEVVAAHILDLSLYEIGNVLLRALRWPAGDTSDQIDDLLVICGPPLTPTPQWRRDAAELAEKHRLSFYDAMFAAAARAMRVPLVSADKQLLAVGLAESASAYSRRIGLLDNDDAVEQE